MVVVAQLVRAPDCGSGGRRFETDLPPILNKGVNVKLALFYTLWGNIWGNDSLFTFNPSYLVRTSTYNTLKH